MQISSRRSDVYVLAKRHIVMNTYDYDGTKTLFKLSHTSHWRYPPVCPVLIKYASFLMLQIVLESLFSGGFQVHCHWP